MADLRTDYQDDVLDASENTARVYDLVDSNGNVVLAGVHLEDKTVYATEGDDYGAADINEQNGKINELSADLSEIKDNISNIQNYSTNAHVIGKWIDGITDVYEKTYYGTTMSQGLVIDNTINSSNSELISFNGAVKMADRWVPYDTSSIGNIMYRATFWLTSDGLTAEVANQSVAKYNLTIRYIQID
jgi:hypothetical protein